MVLADLVEVCFKGCFIALACHKLGLLRLFHLLHLLRLSVLWLLLRRLLRLLLQFLFNER